MSSSHLTAVLIEPNAPVARRMARVLSAATDLGCVKTMNGDRDLTRLAGERPDIVLCGVHDALEVLKTMDQELPFSHLVVWTNEVSSSLLSAASQRRRISSVLGWAQFASTPRPWEIVLAVRRVLDPLALTPYPRDLVGWGAHAVEWRPRSSSERDDCVKAVQALAERVGAAPRIAERVGGVAHEMLMNAMYGAPVDADGTAKYAADRRSDIKLEVDEAPVFRCATDGVNFAMQASDPFGRLERQQVFDGIVRGVKGREGGSPEQLVDTSNGGAGLGMHKMFASSAVLIVDVSPSRRTDVTTIFPLDLNPRDLRQMPSSIHYFEH